MTYIQADVLLVWATCWTVNIYDQLRKGLGSYFYMRRELALNTQYPRKYFLFV